MDVSRGTREFRLDPMYVRCGFYAVAGFVFIGLAAIVLNQIVPNRPGRTDTPWFLALMGLLSLAGLLPWHWRLRVSTEGVARRRLFRWDLWPWEDFASARLKFGFVDRSFVDPARPLWRRKLSLELLTSAESDQVWKWISLVWKPAVTAIPDVLEFRAGSFLKRPVRCDRRGIELGSGTRLQRFTWSEVTRLEVEKIRHERPDFRRLTLELPGTKLVLFRNLQNGIEGRNWSGVEPDVVAQYLLAHVTQDRQLILAHSDDPITQRELDARLLLARGKLGEFKKMCRILAGLTTAVLAGFAIASEWRFVVILGFVVIQYGFIYWFLYRRFRDQVRKLEGVRLASGVSSREIVCART